VVVIAVAAMLVVMMAAMLVMMAAVMAATMAAMLVITMAAMLVQVVTDMGEYVCIKMCLVAFGLAGLAGWATIDWSKGATAAPLGDHIRTTRPGSSTCQCPLSILLSFFFSLPLHLPIT